MKGAAAKTCARAAALLRGRWQGRPQLSIIGKRLFGNFRLARATRRLALLRLRPQSAPSPSFGFLRLKRA